LATGFGVALGLAGACGTTELFDVPELFGEPELLDEVSTGATGLGADPVSAGFGANVWAGAGAGVWAALAPPAFALAVECPGVAADRPPVIAPNAAIDTPVMPMVRVRTITVPLSRRFTACFISSAQSLVRQRGEWLIRFR
jgi:hypothetical protein